MFSALSGTLSSALTSLNQAVYGNDVYNKLLAALNDNPRNALTTDRQKFSLSIKPMPILQ